MYKAELVFMDSKGREPFTTSDIIAEHTKNSYRSIQRSIENQFIRLEQFGIMRFEITLSGKAGRPKKVYQLNEAQATLLITFLKNTDVVADFKVELVRQFYAMREELARQRELRIIGKPIRRSLTDALRDSGEVERMKGHAYSAYTNLAYKLTTGKSARQLRRERGATKDARAVDILTAAELEVYQRKEAALAVLLDAGMIYNNIKAALAGEKTHNDIS